MPSVKHFLFRAYRQCQNDEGFQSGEQQKQQVFDQRLSSVSLGLEEGTSQQVQSSQCRSILQQLWFGVKTRSHLTHIILGVEKLVNPINCITCRFFGFQEAAAWYFEIA